MFFESNFYFENQWKSNKKNNINSNQITHRPNHTNVICVKVVRKLQKLIMKMYHLSKAKSKDMNIKPKKNLTQFLNSLNKGMCLDIFKTNPNCVLFQGYLIFSFLTFYIVLNGTHGTISLIMERITSIRPVLIVSILSMQTAYGKRPAGDTMDAEKAANFIHKPISSIQK